MKEIKGAIFVIISALIFGCMPIAAKYLYAAGCNSTSLVVYRYGLSLPVLFLMALWEQAGQARKAGKATDKRKLDGAEDRRNVIRAGDGLGGASLADSAMGPSAQRESAATQLSGQRRAAHLFLHALKISPMQLGQFFILSLGFASTPVLLFSSYNYISSGSATTIHFSYPVFVILASVLIFREKADRTKLAAILFCVIGLLLFYEPGQENGLAGILLALVSGMTYTFYMMYFDRSVLKFIRPFKTNFYLTLLSAVLVFLFSLATKSFVLLTSGPVLALAFGFSFMLTVVACVLFQIGISLIGAQKSAMLSTFEPITSVIMGVVCFHETVGIKTGLGVVFILAAVLSITVFGPKTAKAD